MTMRMMKTTVRFQTTMMTNEELVCNQQLQVIDEAVVSDVVEGSSDVAYAEDPMSSLPLSSSGAAVVPAELTETTASVAEDESSSIVASSIVAGDAQDDGATLLAQEPAGPSVGKSCFSLRLSVSGRRSASSCSSCSSSCSKWKWRWRAKGLCYASHL